MNADHKRRRRKEGRMKWGGGGRGDCTSKEEEWDFESTWKWWKCFTIHSQPVQHQHQLSISTKSGSKAECREEKLQDEIEILFILLNLKTPEFGVMMKTASSSPLSTHTWALSYECIYCEIEIHFSSCWALSLSEHRTQREKLSEDDALTISTISMDLTFFFICSHLIKFPTEHTRWRRREWSEDDD